MNKFNQASKKEFGKRLKSLRDRYNENQEQFGARFGVERARLGSWEIGKNEPPIDIILKICELCKVSINWLLTGQYDSAESKLPTMQESETMYLKKQIDIHEKYSKCLEENKRLQQQLEQYINNK